MKQLSGTYLHRDEQRHPLYRQPNTLIYCHSDWTSPQLRTFFMADDDQIPFANLAALPI